MYTSILKSDIFFVVTTVAVVVASVCIIIITFYVARILKDIKVLSQKAKDEGEKILDDVRMFREDIHSKEVHVFGQFFAFMASLFGAKRKFERKTSRKNEEDGE